MTQTIWIILAFFVAPIWYGIYFCACIWMSKLLFPWISCQTNFWCSIWAPVTNPREIDHGSHPQPSQQTVTPIHPILCSIQEIFSLFMEWSIPPYGTTDPFSWILLTYFLFAVAKIDYFLLIHLLSITLVTWEWFFTISAWEFDKLIS